MAFGASLGRGMADLAVDLGTSHTRVAVRGRGVAAEVPTAVAIQEGPRGREVVAVGADARKMLGRTPSNTRVVQPMRGGVVTDFEATEQLLSHLFREVGGRGLVRPRVVVCIPSGTTEVERRAVQESARAAGARQVSLVSSPMAAALGADLPVTEPIGSMVVDVGGGHTEVAITSLGGLAVHRAVRVAGDAMVQAIRGWLREQHGLVVGERTAEAIKLRVGCAAPSERVVEMRVRGRDVDGGVPREADISSAEAAQALAEPVGVVRGALLDALQATPPELCADIVDRGVILCGGGALLTNLDRVLGDATNLPVLRAEEPLRCVIRGALLLLEDQQLYERVAAVT